MNAESTKRILREAYCHPAARRCYWSGNGAKTGSQRLNNLPAWDWTPELSVGVPGNRPILLPAALGCVPIELEGGVQWVEKKFHNHEEATAFTAPAVNSGFSGQFIDTAAELAAKLQPGHVVRCPDIQSPLGVAEMMWDESFYIELLEHPESVHALLRKITDFTIDFVKAFRKSVKDRINGAGFPLIWADGEGTMMSDDSVSLLSTEMHRDFSVPYINMIADACGPLFYHSCTWRERYFDNIKMIRNVKAYNWNPGNSADAALIIREFSGRAVIAPHIVSGMHKDNDALAMAKKAGREFHDESDLLEYFLDSMRDDTTLYFWFGNIVENGPVLEKMFDLLAARGFDPPA